MFYQNSFVWFWPSLRKSTQRIQENTQLTFIFYFLFPVIILIYLWIYIVMICLGQATFNFWKIQEWIFQNCYFFLNKFTLLLTYYMNEHDLSNVSIHSFMHSFIVQIILNLCVRKIKYSTIQFYQVFQLEILVDYV